MELKQTYILPVAEIIDTRTWGAICASGVDPSGVEIPFPGFNPEHSF